jgi:hypothetical protein
MLHVPGGHVFALDAGHLESPSRGVLRAGRI